MAERAYKSNRALTKMTANQMCLYPAQKGGILLSKYEQDYLAWAEKQKAKDNSSIDEAALREIGLSDEEIAFVKLMAETEKQFHTPANCGLNDTTRYLLWNLQYFPRTNKATGKITLQSFIDSVGVSYKNEPKSIKDYFLAIRWTVKHAMDGNYPDSALLRIYKKVLAWCLDFERKHGLKEKDIVSVTVNGSSENAEEDKPENFGTQEKEVLADNTSELEPEKMTAKQKNYLLFLMSTVKDDRIRQELQKRSCVLTKAQASKIIGVLVSGVEERVVDFF